VALTLKKKQWKTVVTSHEDSGSMIDRGWKKEGSKSYTLWNSR